MSGRKIYCWINVYHLRDLRIIQATIFNNPIPSVNAPTPVTIPRGVNGVSITLFNVDAASCSPLTLDFNEDTVADILGIGTSVDKKSGTARCSPIL